MIRFHLHAVQYVESHLIRIYCSIWQSLDVSGLKIYHALICIGLCHLRMQCWGVFKRA